MHAAIACEVLIKNAAWMITYEATLLDPDPSPVTLNVAITELKPSQLIGQVLQSRLGGNWDSNTPGRPVHEWRFGIAKPRNELLHLGSRVTGADADRAVTALELLEKVVCDRIAARGKVYPRSAFTLLGQRALDRRGKLETVRRALDGIERGRGGFVAGYRAYLSPLLA